MNILDKVLKNFSKIQNIPSVPFLTTAQIDFLEGLIKQKEHSYINNNYSLIVNYPKNPGKRKLIVMCHTDHPGMILKNKFQGTLMGSVGLDRLGSLLAIGRIPLRIYSPKGEYLGKGELIALDKKEKRIGYIKVDFYVPRNSSAQYDIEYFKESKIKISTYNADNGISVAIMYTLLEEQDLISDYDVYFVFNLHEEVHQVSSWYLAKNNILGISEDDLILNLECLKIENVDTKISSANYEKGLVLQLSNTGCLFGYKSSKENFMEQLTKNVAHKNNIFLQIGLIKDSCDSRPFSYFDLTPNIVTLTVPNKYKHNESEDGDIVPEEIYKKDIVDFYNLTKLIIQETVSEEQVKKEKSFSKKIKLHDTVTDKKLMQQKAKLNDRLDGYYKYIVNRRYFYPQNATDYISDILAKIGLYLSLFIQKFI